MAADTLEIRQVVDLSYEKIVQAMFAALKQMAKMDGEGEDKGQLNYHVILIGEVCTRYASNSILIPTTMQIENMHHFEAEMSELALGSVAAFLQQAQAIYDENLMAYVKLVLRRPFAKIIVRQSPLLYLSLLICVTGILRGRGASPEDHRAE